MRQPTVFVVSADASVGDSVRVLAESVYLQSRTFLSLKVFLTELEPGQEGCLVINAEARERYDREQQELFGAAVASMPCLLLTDRGDVNMAVYGLKAGASDIIQKPYRNHNLLNSINQMLGITATDTSI
ncbi:MAG: hypothetical protein WBM41_09480 [Arenicellales bacterium]